MFLKYEFNNIQKPRRAGFPVEVDLYELATGLYDELDRIGVIRRMKNTPQLGVIREGRKELRKSRYEYMMLQLYFHQLIRKNLQDCLKCTYGNKVKAREFREGMEYCPACAPTIADLLQILTIASNIGHFYNTFTASRAAVIHAKNNEGFRNEILTSSEDPRFRVAAQKILDRMSYLQYHILNSLMVLEKCDQSNAAVQLAKELLYAYLDQRSLPAESKLHDLFAIFRSVRNVAFTAFDLEIAKVPISIDLSNKAHMIVLFRELLSGYNDNRSTKGLIASMSKLLDDTVYNRESNAICYYGITKKMANRLAKVEEWNPGSYYAQWLDPDSPFNIDYPQRRKYVEQGILKLTFCKEDIPLSRALCDELDRFSHVFVGYYDRGSSKQTVVVSMKRNLSRQKKIRTAFRILQAVIRTLRRIPGIASDDPRFILAAKFFLFHLCDEHPIIIKPTIHRETCVLCTRGKLQRIKTVEQAMGSGFGGEDAMHEAQLLLDVLARNTKNEVCISIPASILVHYKDSQGKQLCEFDGMIIYPNRNREQLIFLEAKNRQDKPSRGKKELITKLRNLGLPHDSNSIEIRGKDAIYPYTLNADNE